MKNCIKLALIVTLAISFIKLDLTSQIITKQTLTERVPIGSIMPDLKAEYILNGQHEKVITKDHLAGKVVVLEFWGTWCAPCIKQFPKLNNLVKEFSQEELVIISITAESENIIKPFLKRRPLDTWIVSDTDKSIINDFGVSVYPTTVIINKDGSIHDYISADGLSTDYLSELIDTEKVKTSNSTTSETKSPIHIAQFGKPAVDKKTITAQPNVKTVVYGQNNVETNTKPVYSVSVEKDVDNGFTGGILGKAMGIIDQKGWTMRSALAYIYGVSETLIDGPKEILNTKIKVTTDLPRNNAPLVDQLLKEALKEKFNLDITQSQTKLEMLTLSAPEGVTKYLTPTKFQKGKFSADDGVIAGRNWGMKNLIKNVELVLKESIHDDTNLKDRYDYDLYWDHEKPETIIKALEDQLGLALKKTIQSVEVLKVKLKDPN